MQNPSNCNPHDASFLFSIEPFGLATNWLPTLSVGFEVAVVQKTLQLFRFPFSFSGLLVLVASLIQQVSLLLDSYCKPFPIYRFFGCRTPKDIVFVPEIAQVSHSFLAYSRIAPFEHVQDSLKRHAELLCEAFQSQDATIWVCGSGEMVRDVTKVFGEILPDFSSRSVIEWKYFDK